MSGSSNKILKDQWQQFCYTTGIRGFLFLSKSETIHERLLWGVALLICFVVTINDVVSTVKLYVEVPTNVNLKVVTTPEYNMSNLTLCYAIDQNLFPNAGSSGDLIIKKNYTKYFDDLILIIKNNQLNLLKDSDFETIYQAMYYVAVVFENELHDSTNSNSSTIIMKSNLYNASTIAKKLGALLWCLSELKVNKFNSTFEWTLYDHCLESQIAWFGVSPFANHIESCMTLAKESLSFTTFHWNLKIQIQIVDLLPPKFPQLAIHLSPDPVMSYELPDVLLVEYGRSHAINVKLIGEYHSLTTKENACMTQDSLINCYLNCRIEYFQQSCSCIPAFATFIPSYSYNVDQSCEGLNQSALCFNRTDRAIAYNKCIKGNCYQPCKIQLNSVTVATKDNHDTANTTNIQLVAKVMAYPIFQEMYSFGARQFLAQLGGNLSLWLGASFLVLLHILVSAAKMVYKQPYMIGNETT